MTDVKNILMKYPQLKLVNEDYGHDVRDAVLNYTKNEQRPNGVWFVGTRDGWSGLYIGESFDEAIKHLLGKK